jgi:uncharacterized membrane protein
VSALPGCIQSSCEEKRTCGGYPAPNESDAGGGGELTLLPRSTGGRAGGTGFGLGGGPAATGGATSQGGSAGSEAEPAVTGGESAAGGETAAGGAGDGGEPPVTDAGAAGIEPTACEPNPCAHGTCSALGASFECACDAGYDGDLCEKNIDDCTPNPCRNGGRCEDGVGEYSCVCDGRFTGGDCELPRFEIIEPNFEVDSVSAYEVSADGRTIAGHYVLPGGELEGAFVWRDGNFEVLPTPEGFTQARVDILSADGTALYGSASYYLEQEAYWESRPVVWRDGLGTVLPLAADSYSANIYASTADGSIAVGTSWVTGGRVATIWRGGSATNLELDSLEAYASGVSSDGKVVVGSLARDGRSFAYRWTEGKLDYFPNRVGAESCWASNLIADGTKVLGLCSRPEGGPNVDVLWSNGVIEDLQLPKEQLLQSPEFDLDSISSNGNAATGNAKDSVTSDELPVVWTIDLGMRWMIPVLEDQGVDLSSYRWWGAGKPRGISNDGKVVVGTVYDTDDRYHSFIARLP